MKIDPKFKPELCVSKDETRFNLSEPYYDAEAGIVVATNGHMLVTVPAEREHGETSRFLSPGQMALLRNGESAVQAWGKAKFPNWRGSMPSFHEGDDGTATVALSAGYLMSLAKALGTDKHRQVVLTFRVVDAQATHEAIIVRSAEGGEALGYLMPVRVMLKSQPKKTAPVTTPEKATP